MALERLELSPCREERRAGRREEREQERYWEREREIDRERERVRERERERDTGRERERRRRRRKWLYRETVTLIPLGPASLSRDLPSLVARVQYFDVNTLISLSLHHNLKRRYVGTVGSWRRGRGRRGRRGRRRRRRKGRRRRRRRGRRRKRG